MPTSMGVTNPKFVKGGRKLKKTNIAPFHKPSKTRKKSYSLSVVNDAQRYHTGEYAERCTRLDGNVTNLKLREIKDA